MNKLLVLGGAVALAISCGGALAAEPTGTWSTEGGKASVRVGNCGGGLCGTLVSLREPTDPATGKAKTDKNNADAGKQGRPLIGVQIVQGMKPSGTTNQWKGQVYNAEDGKTYSGFLTLEGDNRIKLQGCVMGGMICKSQSWTRIN